MTTESDPDRGGSDGTREPAVSVRLAVPDMDCPSCARKVDKALQRVEGINDATLQPTTGIADVTYDPDRATETDVVSAIRNSGYDVLETGPREGHTDGNADSGAANPEQGVVPSSNVWRSSRAILTWIGAVMVTIGLLFEFVFVEQNVHLVRIFGTGIGLAEVLFLSAIVASGLPVVRGGYYSAKNLSLDIELLMGTAIIAATGIGYFIEAATLAVLFSIAELLETYAMDRARDSLRELMQLSPETATVLRDGEETTVPAEDVTVGETVVVRPGGKIPLDGIVTRGDSAVDESPITGESVPVDKTPGEAVYAGSINTQGYLEFETSAPAAESTLSRIIELVQGAQQQRTEKEQFVDRFAGYYTPTVVVLAILTAAIPPLLIDGGATVTVAGFSHTFTGNWQTWFIRGLTLLVIACPCAFVISTPVSVVSGITSAAKNGVLIKGGNHLEAMGEADVLAVDKTGTLTTGELAVTDVVALEGSTPEGVLQYAAALERHSEHPIAEAIVARANADPVGTVPDVRAFESITGSGIRAVVDGETVYAGKPALFDDLGFDLSHAHRRMDGGTAEAIPSNDCHRPDCADLENGAIARFADEGKSVVLVGTETELLGIIAVADTVRPGAEEMVDRLHDLGLERVVMLTGDNEGTARAIAEQVGVDEYRAELLPGEKVDAVEALRDEYGDVVMVGDGINDAPALAAADVGIAMGAVGTDTALETADIALMGDDIGLLPYLYELSHTANDVIRQNIWSSLGVKAVLALGVPLGLVSVALAVVVGDMGMSLGVTGNAMRLSRMGPDRPFEA